MIKPIAFLIAMALMLYQCSTNAPNEPGMPDDFAGGSSDQGNALTGFITIEGGPVGSVNYTYLAGIYSAGFIASPDVQNEYADTVYIDSTASFRFDSLQPGFYNLIIWDSSGTYGAFKPGIEIHQDSILDIGAVFLNSFGDLSGTVYDRLRHPAWAIMYLRGTPFFSITDEITGYFEMFNVPAGSYTLLLGTVLAPTGGESTYTYLELFTGQDFDITPGSNTDLDTVIIPLN